MCKLIANLKSHPAAAEMIERVTRLADRLMNEVMPPVSAADRRASKQLAATALRNASRVTKQVVFFLSFRSRQ